MTRILISAVVSCALSGLLGYLLLPVLRALKAGQSIREIGPTWHNYKAGTPMMGGLMFIFAAIICLLLNIPFMQDYTVFFVLALSLCFGFVGFVDDFCKLKKKQNMGLNSLQKALLQMAVSALFLYLMYKTGGMKVEDGMIPLYIPFFNVSFKLHPIVYIFFAMFVMVGCDNAVNLTDGVDGLSSSVTLPVMVFFTAAAVAMGKFDLALLPASLTGGLIAYLFYNWHPAKVFMGDTGSLFLGGVVCALAFALDMPLILILVGFVYICETLSVILQVGYFKLTHGKRLFKMSPIHHHFEMCGWKEEKIVLTFAAVSAIMCVIAWFGISGLVK
ncbi:MAG: phospho-N-acetylmuramoyl-pentapeptide-transferase [Oscillospiraceae bacterium]|nr:phospho-N-acetylmuramoyl-pentapeptide-transferase [Oscillospiraceae bacterium]